eukprot:IDg4209t1
MLEIRSLSLPTMLLWAGSLSFFLLRSCRVEPIANWCQKSGPVPDRHISFAAAFVISRWSEAALLF